MKAFAVGLLFLLASVIITGIGILLFPVLIVLGWLARFILSAILLILVIWLLGKFILFILSQMK